MFSFVVALEHLKNVCCSCHLLLLLLDVGDKITLQRVYTFSYCQSFWPK